MKIGVLGVCAGLGAGKDGCGFGPAKLRELGIISLASKYFDVHDYGDINIPDAGGDLKSKGNSVFEGKIKNYGAVYEYCGKTAEAAYKIAANGDFPLILGGDHSISLGSISGLSKARKDTAVIWVDAHGDVNTPETSDSGNAHGMPGAALLGESGCGFDDLFYKGAKIKAENLFLLGQRSVDPGEEEFINRKGIYLRTWDDIVSVGGVGNAVAEVFAKIAQNNVSRVHLSFDIDFLSAELVPGTGTRVGGGASVSDAKTLIKLIAGSGLLCSMDFVELNPLIDVDGQTAKISMELLEEVFINLR